MTACLLSETMQKSRSQKQKGSDSFQDNNTKKTIFVDTMIHQKSTLATLTGNGIIGVTLSSSSSTFLFSNIKITWSHGYPNDDEVGESEGNVDNIDKDESRGWKKDHLLSFLSVFLTGR